MKSNKDQARHVRSFRIDTVFYKEVKQYCVDKGFDFTSLITRLLHEELDKSKKVK